MKWSALQALLKMCLVCNFTFFDLEGLKLHTILVFTIVAIKFLEQDFIYRCLKSETFGELGGKGWGRGGGGGAQDNKCWCLACLTNIFSVNYYPPANLD